ncbi:MAG: glycosyltransferase family 4 protein [Bacteroidota bacterium]
MKIVILSSWFSERMGYIENCLPKSLAKSGHEVHVISSTAQVYYNHPDYKSIYEPFLGPNILDESQKQLEGYTLHRIPFRDVNGKVCFKKLGKTLKGIRPDVVQVFDAFSLTTLQAAFYKLRFGYKLFTANHTVASVFPLYQKGSGSFFHRAAFYLTRTLPGKVISGLTSQCYPATIDALDIAVRYYGVSPAKVKLAPLGVDTDFFCPLPASELEAARKRSRERLGLGNDKILCIYTGRFTRGKNPLVLARAIDRLVSQGEPFEALFMGNGEQLDEIRKCRGCVVHEFVPYHELPGYYHIADIGVWPRQESTSMIDASACGLPIIISNKVMAKERVEGNGLTYDENDVADLSNTILRMKDPELRKQLGEAGVRKIRDSFSWDKIAQGRIVDYQAFVKE